MANQDEAMVPDGAGVFPPIPAELGVHPLLLAVLHATVFLSASGELVVDPDAADEAFDHMAGYLLRLAGPELDRARADLKNLAEYARQQKWTNEATEFLETFLETCDVDAKEA